MVQVQTNSSVCTAHVTSRRSRLKLYGKQVYLKNSQNFEIELFNPKTVSVLAKIYLNGVAISSSGIILRPGQRVYLERFIDSNNKFLFETYEVEDSTESRIAIQNNGKIRVEFFDEYNPQFSNFYYNTFNGIYNSGTGNANSILTRSSGSTVTSLNDYTFTSSVNYSDTKSFNASSPLETGRVEKGSSSSQDFSYSSGNFNSFASQTVEMQILPLSQKPLEVTELRQYCTSCGVRIKKSNWKFCPSCGNKLD